MFTSLVKNTRLFTGLHRQPLSRRLLSLCQYPAGRRGDRLIPYCPRLRPSAVADRPPPLPAAFIIGDRRYNRHPSPSRRHRFSRKPLIPISDFIVNVKGDGRPGAAKTKLRTHTADSLKSAVTEDWNGELKRQTETADLNGRPKQQTLRGRQKRHIELKRPTIGQPCPYCGSKCNHACMTNTNNIFFASIVKLDAHFIVTCESSESTILLSATLPRRGLFERSSTDYLRCRLKHEAWKTARGR